MKRTYLAAISANISDIWEEVVYVEVASGEYTLVLWKNANLTFGAINFIECEIAGVYNRDMEEVDSNLTGEYVFIDEDATHELVGYPDVIDLVEAL